MYKFLRKSLLLLAREKDLFQYNNIKSSDVSEISFRDDLVDYRKEVLKSFLITIALTLFAGISFIFPRIKYQGLSSILFGFVVGILKYLLFSVTIMFIILMYQIIVGEPLNPEKYSAFVVLPMIIHYFILYPSNIYLRLISNLETDSKGAQIIFFPEKLDEVEKQKLEVAKSEWISEKIKQKELEKERIYEKNKANNEFYKALNKVKQTLKNQLEKFIEDHPVETSLFIAKNPFLRIFPEYKEVVLYGSSDKLVITVPTFKLLFAPIEDELKSKIRKNPDVNIDLKLTDFPCYSIPKNKIKFYTIQGQLNRQSKIVAMETNNVNYIENLGSYGGTKVHTVSEVHDDREVLFSYDDTNGKRVLIRFSTSVLDAFDEIIPEKIKTNSDL